MISKNVRMHDGYVNLSKMKTMCQAMPGLVGDEQALLRCRSCFCLSFNLRQKNASVPVNVFAMPCSLGNTEKIQEETKSYHVVAW